MNKKIISQGGQDGIIAHIISNIHIDNKFCVEFGYDSDTLTGGCGPNCGNLVKNMNWKNLFLGGTRENKEINLFKHFLTTNNILNIFEKYDVPYDLGYLSIDVDSTDLWLLDKILTKYRPSFFSVEFNPNIPIDNAITLPDDPEKAIWSGKVFGASLKCFDIVSKKYNYSLVYAGKYSIDKHHDAFFVRNDLINNKEFIPSLYDFKDSSEPIHCVKNDNKYLLCLDYEYYLKNYDIKEAQEAGKTIAFKYLGK